MCRDRSVSFLNELGYNVIALPRERFEPLMVLGGPPTGLRYLGDLGDLVTGASPPPDIQRDDPVPALAGRRSNRQELSLGVSFLERLLATMGWQGGSLSVGFREAAFVQMVYLEVRHDFVAPLRVGNYLAGARPQSLAPEIFRQCEAVVLVTDTLKSTCFGVAAYDRQEQALELRAEAIQELLGAEAGIRVSASGEGYLVFQGPRPLRFGFRGLGLALSEDHSRLQLNLREDLAGALARGIQEGPRDLPPEVYEVPRVGELLEVQFHLPERS
jgi:hypothetical protein